MPDVLHGAGQETQVLMHGQQHHLSNLPRYLTEVLKRVMDRNILVLQIKNGKIIIYSFSQKIMQFPHHLFSKVRHETGEDQEQDNDKET